MDRSLKTLLGRGSGETVRLRFQREGWVVLQPLQEIRLQVAERS